MRPLVILSPSKQMREAPLPIAMLLYETALESHRNGVVEALNALQEEVWVKVMKVSDKQLPLVKALWDSWQPQGQLQGWSAYTGEAFKFLQAPALYNALAPEVLDRLVVLSAVYGIVRWNTAVAPYRLEMGASLGKASIGPLGKYWSGPIAAALKESGAHWILDLSSAEYGGIIPWDAVGIPVISCSFLQVKEGVAKNVSTRSKQARGAMAKWVLEHGVTEAAELQKFNCEGYTYCKVRSTDNNAVFLRNT